MDKFIEFINNKFCFSTYKIINAFAIYILLCFATAIIIGIIRRFVLLILTLLKALLGLFEKLIFGKRHEKSLTYNFWKLWYLKFEADVTYFIDWLLYYVFKTYKIVKKSVNQKKTIMEKVNNLSISNLVNIFKRIISYFNALSCKNTFILIVVLYYFYKDFFINISNNIKGYIIENKITIGIILDGIEFITIICTAIYIVLDINHKTSGYKRLREERFKELVIFEEKLLNIMYKTSYSLSKNIEIICNHKGTILQDAASNLCGKECVLEKNKIKFYNNNNLIYTKATFHELDEMEDCFQNLMTLEKEFKNSSLSYSNIYLIDHKSMLNKVGQFWILGIEKIEYKKIEFLCKSSLEKWYNNRFVKYYVNGTRQYISESATVEQIYEASYILDLELKRALILQLYLENYIKKINKRIKNIHRFSRYNIL